jgi:hypothetical protein
MRFTTNDIFTCKKYRSFYVCLNGFFSVAKNSI